MSSAVQPVPSAIVPTNNPIVVNPPTSSAIQPVPVTAAPVINVPIINAAPANPVITTVATIAWIDLSAIDAIKVVMSALDRRSNNWPEWSVNFKDYLLSKHAWPYVLGTINRPMEATDSLGTAMWDANNEAIVAIMRGRCALEEKLFLVGQTNAFCVWNMLRERHEKIGPVAQINLIQKLLQARYKKNEHYSTTSVEITEGVQRIYAMGLPSANTFTLILMMNAMGDELPQVRDQIAEAIVRSSADDPYMPMQARARLDMEQQITDSKSLASGNLVLAVTTKQSSSRTNKTCSVCGKSGHLKCCANPKCPPGCRISHMWAECFSEGGGRAGQHEAVLKEKAKKARAGAGYTPRSGAIATGKPGTVRFSDAKGHAYFIDLDSQTVFPLHSEPTSTASSTVTQEFAGLASDILSPEIARSFATTDAYEYDALFLDVSALHASIDWHSHSQPVDVTAITYKAPNRHAPTTIDPAITPFFLDTGVSVHISNCQSDFFRLCPVAPRAVHSVGGSAVQAIGIGSIHLIVAKGIHLTLENVLFIPNATM